ncbi:DUF637 domain-containing protein [Polynucleobacter sp.]|jgi:hypothetical protein|uniref:DUF637 domain-containing protein n=1 Tax=Polynucleobacter sp. TaxID=2029855 RepID=UPI0037C562A0
MTSLATQAAISLANNQGDLGKTLQDLGSDSAVKNTLAAMVTAGVMSGVTAATDTMGTSVNSSGNLQVDSVGARVGAVGIRTVTSAGLSTTLQGGSFQDNLTTSAILSGASEAYLDVVGRNATGLPGEARESAHYEPNPDGTPPLVNGKEGQNFGNNNNSGCFACQQGALSNFVNPLGNDIGTFHDTWTQRIQNAQGGQPVTPFQNISTMLPSAIIALPAAYDQSGLRYLMPPVIQLNQDQQKQKAGDN